VIGGEAAQDQDQLSATLQRLEGFRSASEATDAEAARMLEEVEQDVDADEKTRLWPLQGLSAVLKASHPPASLSLLLTWRPHIHCSLASLMPRHMAVLQCQAICKYGPHLEHVI
jgi:hypothetical protein